MLTANSAETFGGSGTDASRVVKSKLRAEAFRELEDNWDETNIGGEKNDHRGVVQKAAR